MSLLPIPVPEFPNVPDVPGVPPVLRDVAQSFLTSGLQELADVTGLSKLINLNFQWGVFSGLLPAILGDSVVAFEFDQEYNVPQYPVEDGGFQSYNKVRKPRELVITFTKGGSEAARAAFLSSIAAACDSIALYTVATPEVTYKNLSLKRYSLRRTAREGATLLTVDIHAQEVRVGATAAFTNTAAAASAATTNAGAVQAVNLTTSELGQVGALIKGLF